MSVVACEHLRAGVVLPWVVIDGRDVCLYCLSNSAWAEEPRFAAAMTLWRNSNLARRGTTPRIDGALSRLWDNRVQA